ncbi:MAG TPA: hypothetical protein VHS96_03510 [Bacteroidia bacterium]|nr:hypothetical protein [Bacteroidia bacterium]
MRFRNAAVWTAFALVAGWFLSIDVQAQTAPANRSEILARLKAKVAQKKPLIAHVLVPLCDNANQGIVKVNASLGNGQNLKTNLYWGAGYGMRTHFQRQTEWKTLSVSDPAEPHILERLVMRRTYPNGATVILIADAYDGAFMQRCIEDYLDALCGIKTGSVAAENEQYAAWAGADLLAFNGHNGLMDTEVAPRSFQSGNSKDAVVIACFSHSWFEERLQTAAAYPLVTTTNLLAPEAYIMRAIIDTWAMLKSGEEIDLAAAQGNTTYQKCSLAASNRLFRTGW